MYHGIVYGTVPVASIDRRERLYRISLDLDQPLLEGLVRGASVGIDGVCLTVAGIDNRQVSFDVMGESLDCTTLKLLDAGDLVNIERSARSNDEVGGHLLSGHVDGMVQIVSIERPPNNHIITCSVPDNLSKYLFRKGYVGLNGASLTIAEVDRKQNKFSVHLIPETLRLTTFGAKKVGDFLNMEIERNTQVLVDTVHDFLESRLAELAGAGAEKSSMVTATSIMRLIEGKEEKEEKCS
jgi:riboflavin synthase